LVLYPVVSVEYYQRAMTATVSSLSGPSWSDEIRFAEPQDTLRFTVALNQLLAKRPAN